MKDEERGGMVYRTVMRGTVSPPRDTWVFERICAHSQSCTAETIHTEAYPYTTCAEHGTVVVFNGWVAPEESSELSEEVIAEVLSRDPEYVRLIAEVISRAKQASKLQTP